MLKKTRMAGLDRIAFHFAAAAACCLPAAARAVDVPMTADRWTAPHAEFVPLEGFPHGMMILKDGKAVLGGLTFRDGTIEFDIDAYAPGLPGLIFRSAGDGGEEFYLRTEQNCPASDDCIQYTPKVRGVLLWNLFPQYQTIAPVMPKQWNHVKVVISGRRLLAYINRAATPSLVVGRLEGDTQEGGLELRGPGTFANLTVTPDAVDGLPPAPLPDPTAQDPRYFRHWLVSPAFTMRQADAPGLGEPVGADPLPAISGAWLKTEVTSDRAQTKQVAMGIGREAWVFVNGRAVFKARNLYDPVAARLAPDGRTSPDNASFALPLQPGRNEILVLLDNNTPLDNVHSGWGLEMRLGDVDGAAPARE